VRNPDDGGEGNLKEDSNPAYGARNKSPRRKKLDQQYAILPEKKGDVNKNYSRHSERGKREDART